jgi:WD40 repeat protein
MVLCEKTWEVLRTFPGKEQESDAPAKKLQHGGYVSSLVLVNTIRGEKVPAHLEVLLSCSYDCTVRVWAKNTGKLLGAHMTHKAVVHCVEYWQSGGEIISTSHDGTVCAWDLASGEVRELCSFEWDPGSKQAGESCGVTALAIAEPAPPGNEAPTATWRAAASRSTLVICGNDDGKITAVRPTLGDTVHTFIGHTKMVSALCIMHYSHTTATAVNAPLQSQARYAAAESGGQANSFADGVTAALFSSSWDHSVRQWCLQSGMAIAVFDGHQGPVLTLLPLAPQHVSDAAVVNFKTNPDYTGVQRHYLGLASASQDMSVVRRQLRVRPEVAPYTQEEGTTALAGHTATVFGLCTGVADPAGDEPGDDGDVAEVGGGEGRAGDGDSGDAAKQAFGSSLYSTGRDGTLRRWRPRTPCEFCAYHCKGGHTHIASARVRGRARARARAVADAIERAVEAAQGAAAAAAQAAEEADDEAVAASAICGRAAIMAAQAAHIAAIAAVAAAALDVETTNAVHEAAAQIAEAQMILAAATPATEGTEGSGGCAEEATEGSVGANRKVAKTKATKRGANARVMQRDPKPQKRVGGGYMPPAAASEGASGVRSRANSSRKGVAGGSGRGRGGAAAAVGVSARVISGSAANAAHGLRRKR